MKKFSAREYCRIGIIAALYVALTLVFSPVAFGPLQVRPAEALTLLPLFYLESVPALFVGCLIANFLSPFGIVDVVIGSLITLISALLTFFIGKAVKKDILKILCGSIPPVLLNALGLPVIWLFVGGEGAFFYNALTIFATQMIFVVFLGGALYFSILKMRKKGVSVLF